MPQKFVLRDGAVSYAPLADGTLVSGRWRVLKTLGFSVWGAVYQVAGDATGDLFALKEVYRADSDAEVRAAFEREAAILKSLTHAALPPVLDYFIEDDGGFLLTEYVRGALPKRFAEACRHWYPPVEKRGDFKRDLGSMISPGYRIQNFRPFEIVEVLEWAQKVLDALEVLHSHGLVHRDVRPENLKLMPDGKIKLLDCGVARVRVDDYKDQTISTRDVTLPPQPLERVLRTNESNVGASYSWSKLREFYPAEIELFVERNPIDWRSDVYALGATVYKLLTLEYPRGAMWRAGDVWARKPDCLPPARDREGRISKEVSDVLEKALALHPADRPTVAELRRMFADAVKSGAESVFNLIKVPPKSVDRYRLAQTFVGHEGAINRVAFSPDGKTVASSSSDKTVKLWDAASGILRKTLTGNTHPLAAVVFSPDGETIAVAVNDSLGMWSATRDDVAAEQILWRGFRGAITHSSGSYDSMSSIAYSPDGRTIAAARRHWLSRYSFEEEYLGETITYPIEFWDALNGEYINSFTEHQNQIRTIAFSPDGALLASGGADKTVKLCNAANYSLLQTLGAQQEIWSIAFSPDSRTISASVGDKIKLWNVKSGDLIKTFGNEAGTIRSIAYSPDGKNLAGNIGEKIKIWNAASGDLIQILEGHDGDINSIAFSPDGEMIASGSEDQTIILWNGF